MEESGAPWERVLELRAERKKLRERLMAIDAEEMQATRECRDFIAGGFFERLSNRENQILRMIQTEPEISNKEIGWRLNICERTVKFHMSNLFAKLNVPGRSGLASIGIMEGKR